MWFGTRRVPAGGYACLLPGNVRDKEEFYRAKKSKKFRLIQHPSIAMRPVPRRGLVAQEGGTISPYVREFYKAGF
jgi:hypothetical protein